MEFNLIFEFEQDGIKYYSLDKDIHFQCGKTMIHIKHQIFITKYKTLPMIVWDYLSTDRTCNFFTKYKMFICAMRFTKVPIKIIIKVVFKSLYSNNLKF